MIPSGWKAPEIPHRAYQSPGQASATMERFPRSPPEGSWPTSFKLSVWRSSAWTGESVKVCLTLPSLLINLQHSWAKTELLQSVTGEFLSYFPRPALGWGSAQVLAWILLGIILETLIVVGVGLESSVSWTLLRQISRPRNQPRHPLTQRQELGPSIAVKHWPSLRHPARLCL